MPLLFRVRTGLGSLFIATLTSLFFACNNGGGSSISSLSADGSDTGKVTPSSSPIPSSSPSSTPSPTASPSAIVVSSPAELAAGQDTTLQVSGGTAPYQFQVTSGTCSISSSTGKVTAPSQTGICEILVKDAKNLSSKISILIVTATKGSANDPYLSYQTYLVSSNGLSIEANKAWTSRTDCSGIRVAIIDTGVDHTHPDISTNLAQLTSGSLTIFGRNFTDEAYNVPSGYPYSTEFDIRDHNFHGTHVAGILGAVGNNGVGIAGVCWRAQLLTVKTMDYKGEGTVSDVIDGINWAMLNNAKIINISLSGVSSTNSNFNAFRSKLQAASDQGILLVVAAGNESKNLDSNPVYPGGFKFANQITVGATLPKPSNVTMPLSSFSNYGVNTVEITAPGELENTSSTTIGIPSLSPVDSTSSGSYRTQYNVEKESQNKASSKTPSSYMRSKGTSMATPMVSGAAALLWASNPSLTAAQVKAKILESGRTVVNLDGKVKNKKALFLRTLLAVP